MQSREGKLKATISTAPLRIFDFVVSKDHRKIIATTSVVGGSGHGTLRPTASRLPVTATTSGRTTAAPVDNANVPSYSISRMERDIVMFDIENGSVIS